MKDKPNSTRIYDEDGFRRRAACICVRKDSDEVIIIIIMQIIRIVTLNRRLPSKVTIGSVSFDIIALVNTGYYRIAVIVYNKRGT